MPRLKGFDGPAAELVRFKLLGITQVELLPEDEITETSLGLVNLLLLIRQSTLGRKVQRVVRGLQDVVTIDQLLHSRASVGQLLLEAHDGLLLCGQRRSRH